MCVRGVLAVVFLIPESSCAYVSLWSLHCSVCLSRLFLQVAWFQEEQVFDPNTRQYAKSPVGNLCKVGGITMDTFMDGKPTTTVDFIIAKIKPGPSYDPEFESRITLVRQAVQAALLANIDFGAREFVRTHNDAGLTISRNVALVPEASFRTHMGCGPGDEGCSAQLTRFPFSWKVDHTGIIMEIPEATAKALPFETVQQWASSARCLSVEHLKPALKFRTGQAQDRYRYSLSSMASAWPKALQGPPGCAPKYQELLDEANAIQASRQLQNYVQSNAGNMAGSLRNVSASTLQADAEDFSLVPQGRGRGGGRGAGAAKAKPAARGVSRAVPAAAAAAPLSSRFQRLSPPTVALDSLVSVRGSVASASPPASSRSPFAAAVASVRGSAVSVDLRGGGIDIEEVLSGATQGR